MTQTRLKLARDIATGLAGWYQLQLAQGFGDFFGEDSAQLITLQILSSRVNFGIKPSHTIAGHEGDQARLDIALNAKGAKETSYGAIEIKWLGSSNRASSATRQAIIADALRLSIVQSTNMKANLLVVGGRKDKFDGIFGSGTNQVEKTEQSRKLFAKLFQQALGKSETVTFSDIKLNFQEAAGKLPKSANLSDQDKLQVTLLATADAVDHNATSAGCVSVWLCLKGSGKKQKPSMPLLTDPGNSSTSGSCSDASASAAPSPRSAGSAPASR